MKKTTFIPEISLKKVQSNFPAVKISDSDTAATFIRQFYADDIELFESSFILLLNQANNTIGYAKISQGGISGTVVDCRIICKYAIESLCSAVILCHNHPSGNLKASEADDRVTSNVKTCLELLGIKLFDHIIITAKSHYSYADNGKMI